MANKIEEAAIEAYFSYDSTTKTATKIFIDGYKCGYQAAMAKIRECLNESCNKLKLESINKLINENIKSHETDSKK